jgi:hypothetical protein
MDDEEADQRRQAWYDKCDKEYKQSGVAIAALQKPRPWRQRAIATIVPAGVVYIVAYYGSLSIGLAFAVYYVTALLIGLDEEERQRQGALRWAIEEMEDRKRDRQKALDALAK